MFIQTESTPNPETIKFLPGRPVMAEGVADFAAADEGARSPLARALFAIEGVERVFFGADFISVTKSASIDWTHLKPALLGAIMEHFTAGAPLFEDDGAAAADAGHGDAYDEADEEIVAQIRELLDTRVRPAVAQDGGDITFQGFRDGIVFLHLRGACAGCPSSTMTLKAGIENMMRHYIPEVEAVEAV
jgi:Fe-S cluster biogenesis protein NfuA